MPKTRRSHADQMARLDDALLDSIFALSDADIDAELQAMGLVPSEVAANMRAAVEKGLRTAAKSTLAASRASLTKFKQDHATWGGEAASGRTLLDRLKARDPELASMMMAARKGKTLSESDEAGIAEDLANLEKLSRKPE